MIADANSSDLAMKGTQMEVTVIKQTENELEVQIKDANETLLGPLLNRTLADPQVDYASYYMGHILLDDPRFYVRTKKGTPKAAIDRAMESILTDIATIQDKILKSPVGPGRGGGKGQSEPSTHGRKPKEAKTKDSGTNINWESIDSRIVNDEKHNAIFDDICNVPGYVTLDGVKEISEIHGVHENIVKSLRSNHLRNKIRVNARRISRKIGHISKQYIQGISIEELSREYDYPKVNILRKILGKEYGLDRDATSHLWRESPDSELIWEDINNEVLRKDWEASINSDEITSKVMTNNTQNVASVVEDKISVKLDRLGLKYKTEKDLREEGCGVTPDFLLTDGSLIVNRTEIKWIEVKSFFGYPSSPKDRNILSQIKKCNKKLGKYGILIHKAGIVASLPSKYDDLCIVMTGEQFDYFTENYTG